MNSDIFEIAEHLALEATEDPSKTPCFTTASRLARRAEGRRSFFNPNGKNGKMTQCEKIIEHIQKNGSITQREAYIDYSIQSFTRRIADLRADGYDIYSVPKKHPVTGQEYTRYFLIRSKAAEAMREEAFA